MKTSKFSFGDLEGILDNLDFTKFVVRVPT
jgi:hypothetical protein